MDIGGTTSLVTGGTDGIGLALARQLGAAGGRVIVVGRRQALLDRARGHGLEAIGCDLADAAGCDALLAALAGRSIDVLVNNAGADPPYAIDTAVDIAAIDRAIFLNLNAPIRLVTGLLPALRARPRACIVNVTSGLAIAPSADAPVYCATKAGLRSFTMALRAQLAATSVSVIEALPPLVDTAMTSAIAPRGKISPGVCAGAIVAAIRRGDSEANIGRVRLLRALYSVSPALARRLMLAA